MMPGIDGWTVLAAIKGDPELPDIPVILLTIVDEKNRGFSLGASEYLVKPIDRNKLTEVLRNICGSVGGHVLVIDDDDTVRRGMRLALEPGGWKVTEAENGQVALDCLAAARPDAIILDLMMPEMDGFEFLDELRRHADWRDIPVVVVTGRDLTEDDRIRLNGGVERIIQKTERDAMLHELRGELSQMHRAAARRSDSGGLNENSLRRGQRRQRLRAEEPADAGRVHGSRRYRWRSGRRRWRRPSSPT